MMPDRSATPNQIRKAGIDALFKTLGPIGMIRFLQQFDQGKGDYTVFPSAKNIFGGRELLPAPALSNQM